MIVSVKSRDEILKDFINYYKSEKCIACGLHVAESLEIWSHVYHDNFKTKDSIVRCKLCGLGYVYPFLTSEDLIGLYSKDYSPHTHDETLKRRRNFFYEIFTLIEERVLKVCIVSKSVLLNKALTSPVSQLFFQTFPIFTARPKGESVRILDYGCGGGQFLALAKKAGCDVYGVEIEEGLIKKLTELGINATSRLDDYVDNKIEFDIIRANQVLEHMGDPRIVLDKFYTLLKAEGELIIGIPNFNTPARIFKRFFYMHLPYHRLYFTKKSIYNMLIAANFNPIYFKTKSCGVFSWSLLRSLRKQSSIYTIPLKLLEIFILSLPMDIFGIGDCMEIYARKLPLNNRV